MSFRWPRSFTHFFVSAFVSLETKPPCNSSKSSSTMVKSSRLAGGRLLPLLRECLEDLAILRRRTAKYQLQVCNPQPVHAFLCACVCFFRDKTALQLLEVVIHHGEIKPLGGWQAVAFTTRTLGRLGHSTSTHC